MGASSRAAAGIGPSPGPSRTTSARRPAPPCRIAATVRLAARSSAGPLPTIPRARRIDPSGSARRNSPALNVRSGPAAVAVPAMDEQRVREQTGQPLEVGGERFTTRAVCAGFEKRHADAIGRIRGAAARDGHTQTDDPFRRLLLVHGIAAPAHLVEVVQEVSDTAV